MPSSAFSDLAFVSLGLSARNGNISVSTPDSSVTLLFALSWGTYQASRAFVLSPKLNVVMCNVCGTWLKDFLLSSTVPITYEPAFPMLHHTCR